MNKIVVPIIAIVIILLSNIYTFNCGKSHYQINGHTHLCDIIEDNLPNMEKYYNYHNIVPILILVPILFVRDKVRFLKYAATYLLIFFTIRAITIAVTVLPNSNSSPLQRLDPIHYILGHSYDKISSGHFAFAFILFSLYIKFNVLSTMWAIILGILVIGNGVFLVMVRAHYTVDIVISFVISFLLLNGYEISKFIESYVN